MWAGWDHLQQAKTLAGYYVDASTNLGWTPEKLQPFLDEDARKQGTTVESLGQMRFGTIT